MTRIVSLVDTILIIFISFSAIAVMLIDYYGLATQGGVLDGLFAPSFFSSFDIQKSILILLALIGLKVCLLPGQINIKTPDPEKTIERALRNYDGTYIIEFSDAADMENYISKRIREANFRVCDLSWKDSLSNQYSLPKRKKAIKTYEDSIKVVSSNISYNEIFIFNDTRRIEKMKNRISENRTGYSCRYYREEGAIPRLQFVLIDQEEVIFASSSYPHLCSIKGEAVASIFTQYFDNAWGKAKVLKDGDEINHSEIEYVLSSVPGK